MADLVDAWVDAEQQTLLDLLDRRLAQDPDGPFLDCCGTPYTAAELDRESNRVATALAELGVRHGSTVATILENGPAAVLSWFAIHKLGATWPGARCRCSTLTRSRACSPAR
jgi:crotonobetaine/carnitine-CoA ligase